jgi:hypothetical protein
MDEHSATNNDTKTKQTTPIADDLSTRSVSTLTVQELLGVMRQSMGEIKNEILTSVNTVLAEYDKNFKAVDTKLQIIDDGLTNVKQTVAAAHEAAKTNAESIQTLQNNVQTLHNSVNQIDTVYYDAQIDEFQKKIKDLEEETDLRNRGMRSNLVFLGIEENEDADHHTHDIIAEFLVEHLGVETKDLAMHDIVRAHRGRQNRNNGNNNNRRAARPIYIKFARDDVAADYLKRSIQEQLTKKGFKVSQQFSYNKKYNNDGI